MGNGMTEITPEGATLADLREAAANQLGMAVEDVEDVVLVAQVTRNGTPGYVFGGAGDPIDIGSFLHEALEFLKDQLAEQLAYQLAKQLGIEVPPEVEKRQSRKAEVESDGSEGFDHESYTDSQDHESYENTEEV